MTSCSPNSPGVYKVIFVDIPAILAELFAAFLREYEPIVLAGEAHTSSALDDLLQKERAHVALVSSRCGPELPTAVPFLQQIKYVSPQTRPIILGRDLSAADETLLLHEGAKGLLSESNATLSVLLKCVRSVAEGQIWANGQQLDRLLSSLSRPRSLRVTNALGNAILSRREEEVLQLLSEGLSNRDMAVALKLSEHTVKNHLFRIFDKLGVSSRMEAVLYAMAQRSRPEFPVSSEAATQAISLQ